MARPDSISIPLFIHILGAMVLIGGLLVAASSVLAARGDARLLRLGYMGLLAVALPGYIVMRIGAEWTASKEHLTDLPDDPTWLGIGYATADIGGLLLLIALILGGIGMRRSRKGGGGGLLKASSVLATLLVAVYVVSVWAMGAKPT
jgi:hypothetical protein